MADFKEVLQKANDGYHQRSDYPKYEIHPWDDRVMWSRYLTLINDEMDATEPFHDKLDQVNEVRVKVGDGHWSDCALHNEPAEPNGPCNCGDYPSKEVPE